MTAFATAADLATLLKVTFSPDEEAQATALLEAASDHLRSVIGQNIYPQETVTYTAYPSLGREDLPQWPVVSVASVEVNGEPVRFEYRPGFIMVDHDGPVDVTFTYGYMTVPGEIKRVTLVLAAQALQMLETTGSLTAGGLSSVSIDDFRAAFADGGAGTGISLTRHAEAALRRQFGRGGIDVIEATW